MKIFPRLLVLAFPLLLLATALPASAEDETDTDAPYAAALPEIGRYRLFDGQYSVSSYKGPDSFERHLFKLDTVSGQVWIGKQAQYVDRKTGRVVQQRYWEPFEQYLEAPPAPAAK
jgi:opacity protein-like surface antigen